jgi:Tol biopolymer transport system component
VPSPTADRSIKHEALDSEDRATICHELLVRSAVSFGDCLRRRRYRPQRTTRGSHRSYSANGHNQSTWQLHSVNATGSQDFILFPSSLPKYHPSYGPDGRLAYFSGWSDDPNAGIFIDAHPTHSVPYASASHLSWRPDASAIIYSGPGIGLQELTLESGAVTELLPLEGGETIQAPAVSADGTRIALVRLGGSRNSQEIWTADASGANPQQLTTGSSDDSPAWTPNDSYLAFSRWVSTSPGIYVMPAGGGTPVRVVSVSPGAGSMSWSR